MTQRRQAQEIDTFAIGPSVCGNFTHKDLCHACVAKGLFARAICFTQPGKCGQLYGDMK